MNTSDQPAAPAPVSRTNRTRFGKYSKKTRGLISLSTLAATTPYSISRNAWLPRGTPSIRTHIVAAQQRTASPSTGRRMRQQGDAAGLQGDPFAVSGQAAEGDEQPQQERHRDGDGQCGRHEQDEHARDDGEGDALADESLGVAVDRVHHQHQGEDREREDERGDDFAQRVAVDDAEHATAATITQSAGARQRAAARTSCGLQVGLGRGAVREALGDAEAGARSRSGIHKPCTGWF